MPQGADQFINAPWWARSGAVTVVAPLDPTTIVATIAAALDDPAMRSAAAAVAQEISAMPSPSATADRLIELAGRSTGSWA